VRLAIGESQELTTVVARSAAPPNLGSNLSISISSSQFTTPRSPNISHSTNTYVANNNLQALQIFPTRGLNTLQHNYIASPLQPAPHIHSSPLNVKTTTLRNHGFTNTIQLPKAKAKPTRQLRDSSHPTIEFPTSTLNTADLSLTPDGRQ
jgi:hypothetical protein